MEEVTQLRSATTTLFDTNNAQAARVTALQQQINDIRIEYQSEYHRIHTAINDRLGQIEADALMMPHGQRESLL